MLEGLAQVAATQENVNICDIQLDNSDIYLLEDENDEDYLIEYNINEVNNLKPQKWKCGECKVILRGDVSYEGHMNFHKQLKPHTCDQCQIKFRCRTALKRHKDLRHTIPSKNENTVKITFLCIVCNKHFYCENIFNLHQAFVHGQGDKCPLQCDDLSGNNLKDHLESLHYKELNFFEANDFTFTSTYQCFRCCDIFKNLSILQDHLKSCQMMEEESLQEDNIVNENESVIKVGRTGTSEQCNICGKKLLKRNLNKHMELHKRKEGEKKDGDDTKSYLCASCRKYCDLFVYY